MAAKDGDLNIQGVTHVSAKCPNIVNYWLLGDSGSVTLKGIFVDREGAQTGIAVSTTIPQGTGSNDPVQIAVTIPGDAVAFVGNISGNIRMGLYKPGTTALAADLKANYANYPLIVTGNALNFGSVAIV